MGEVVAEAVEGGLLSTAEEEAGSGTAVGFVYNKQPPVIVMGKKSLNMDLH